MSRLAGASPPAASWRGLDAVVSSAAMSGRQSLPLGGSDTSPLTVCQHGGVGQCAQLGFAMRKGRGGTSPVLRKCWSVRCSADMASARCRIVLDQPSPAARPGTRYAGQLWRSPATAKLHNAALPSVSASQSQAPFVAVTASRPSGEGNGPLCKIAFAGVGRTAVGTFRSHPRPTRRRLAPLWLLWHCGIGLALRAGCLVSGLRPVMLCVPRPPLWPRRCAALAPRWVPIRPQGAPSSQRHGQAPPAAADFKMRCYCFNSILRNVYGG